MSTHRIFVSRHIIFDETQFPFKHNSSDASLSAYSPQSPLSWLPPKTAAPLSSHSAETSAEEDQHNFANSAETSAAVDQPNFINSAVTSAAKD
jgi:hypothetical protein